MILGNYTFEWDPDSIDIPEMRKTVSRQETYASSDVHQWGAFLEGTEVQLRWDWMSADQYAALRDLYLSTRVWWWSPEPSIAFKVVVSSLGGKYGEVVLDELPYRLDVSMTLNIRRTTDYITTTTVPGPEEDYLAHPDARYIMLPGGEYIIVP